MTERFYRFAGLELTVRMDEERLYENERGLEPFAVEAVSNPHWFEFSVVDELDSPVGECITEQPDLFVYQEGERQIRYINLIERRWQAAGIRVEYYGREHCVQLKRGRYPGVVGAKTVLNTIAAEHLVAREHGFIFHSSYIDWQGRGILFTAPSGTGKSTQAELWHRLRGAEIINGDRSAVRIVDGQVLAEGVPFSGSSQICVNRSLPLAAVVYLSQAPTTSIRQLQGYEAFFRIWEGCSVNTWDAEDMRLVSETVQRVSAAVPVYHLACTPDESAVIALERQLTVSGEL